jgi:Competence protein
MLIALRNNQRIIPTATGQRANCPECSTEVLSKCGEINIWHWAHVTTVNCDIWGEPEGEWHLNWKKDLPLDWVEVVMEQGECKHRADIRLPTGLVIELQHSPISVEDIHKREAFYQNMIWIFDLSELPKSEESENAVGFYDEDYWTNDLLIDLKLEDEDDGYVEIAETYIEPRFILRQWSGKDANYRTFRWKHARKHIAYAKKPVFLDLGNNQLLRLKKMYSESPVGGWGFLVERERLVQSIVDGKLSLRRRSASA